MFKGTTKIIRDKHDNTVSLKRVGYICGFVVMSYGFIYNFDKHTWEWYIAYPVGLACLYFPQLAINLFMSWKGGQQQNVTTNTVDGTIRTAE